MMIIILLPFVSMEGMGVQGKGCVHRIRKCVVDLLWMAEEEHAQELAADDEEAWEVMGSELRLKATFLYCDLNQLIAAAGWDDPRKQVLADVANKLFAYVEQLELAVKRRSLASTQVCYKDTAHVLQQLMTALMPFH